MARRNLIAEVYASTSAGSWWCGSAYGLGRRLLLTAAHVVLADGAPAGEVKVRMLGAADLVNCEVVWHRYGNGLDVALLRATNPNWNLPPQREPVRWGRLVTDSTGVTVNGTGFPDIQQQLDGIRDSEHLSGRINALTGTKAGMYSVAVDNPPVRVAASSSPWRGMSGAALFCEDLLTAVVAGDPSAFASARITAVPVAAFVTDSEFRTLIEADSGRPVTVEPAELRRLFAEPPKADSPAALLRADIEAVPFYGRADLLKTLETWCEQVGWFSARLIVGGGGEGKTRLGVELCKRLHARDWVAGRLAEDVPQGVFDSLERLTLPLLLVVDYAETRKEQLQLLGPRLANLKVPVRLLFFARSAGEWVTQLAAATPDLSSLVTAPVRQLDSLATSSANCALVWRDAVGSLAGALPSVPGYADIQWSQVRDTIVQHPPREIFRDGNRPVLGLHMDALATLLEAGLPMANSAMQTEDVLLLHEQRYWENAAMARGLVLGSVSRQRAVVSASGWTAADESEALRVLSGVVGLRDLDEDRTVEVARWISGLYQTSGLFWGSLQPDRLGEHLVGTTLKDQPRLFHEAAAVADELQIHHLLTVLARAEAHQPHLADVLGGLITEHPARFGLAAVAVITETDNPASLILALDALIATPDELPLEFLESVIDAIPKGTERLVRQASVLAEVIVERYRALADSGVASERHRYAEALHRLSLRLDWAGRQGEATAMARKSVFQYRQLAAADPNAFLPLLAESLASLANRYAYRDRKTDPSSAQNSLRARQAIWEAVEIAEQLVRSDPDTHANQLARYLTMRANRLADIGRHDWAIAQIERAVAINNPSVGMSEDDFLAESLLTLAKRLAYAGRHDEALAATQRAATIRRTTAEQAIGSASEADQRLAEVLSQLAHRLDHSGDAEAALGYAKQAAEIARRLADARPDANLSRLAEYLGDVARRCAELGREYEAMDSFMDTIATWRRLAEVNPSRYLPQLERALYVFATSSVARSRPDLATVYLEQAVEICRRLVEADPFTYGPRMAESLMALGKRYIEGDRVEPALTVLRSAGDVYRELAKEQPEIYLPFYARIMVSMARRQIEQGRDRDALVALREGTETYARVITPERAPEIVHEARSLVSNAEVHAEEGRIDDALTALNLAAVRYEQAAASEPDPTVVARARELLEAAKQLTARGCDEEALTALEQAADVYNKLAERKLMTYVGPYVSTLRQVAKQLGDLGRDAEAVAVLDQVTLVYQRAADVSPSRYTSLHAQSFLPLANRLTQLESGDDAVAALQHALDIYARAEEAAIQIDREGHAYVLATMSRLLANLGRTDESVALLRRAAAFFWHLAEDDAEAYLVQYAHLLVPLARRLSESGSSVEALAIQKEASAVYGKLATITPTKHTAIYAWSLVLVAQRLYETGLAGEALATLRESVLVWQQLGMPVPDVYRPQLAEFLYALAKRLMEFGWDDLSAAVARRSVAVLAQLAETDAKTYAPQVMGAARAAARRLVEREREDLAMELLELATRIQRQLGLAEVDFADPVEDLSKLRAGKEHAEVDEATSSALRREDFDS